MYVDVHTCIYMEGGREGGRDGGRECACHILVKVFIVYAWLYDEMCCLVWFCQFCYRLALHLFGILCSDCSVGSTAV